MLFYLMFFGPSMVLIALCIGLIALPVRYIMLRSKSIPNGKAFKTATIDALKWAGGSLLAGLFFIIAFSGGAGR